MELLKDFLRMNTQREIPTLEEVEKAYILRVYAMCNQNRNLTAKTLGIGRMTIHRKLKSYGL